MRKILIAICCIAGASVVFVFMLFSRPPAPPAEHTMTLESPAFQNNTFIPARYAYKGDNVSPPLRIAGVPPAAQSFALVVEDPDAPAKPNWTHWIVWNIDPKTTEMREGALPAGAIEGMNDFGDAGYGGPMPPPGPAHRYVFTLFALDVPRLAVPGQTKDALTAAIRGHILDTATLTGLYQRE